MSEGGPQVIHPSVTEVNPEPKPKKTSKGSRCGPNRVGYTHLPGMGPADNEVPGPDDYDPLSLDSPPGYVRPTPTSPTRLTAGQAAFVKLLPEVGMNATEAASRAFSIPDRGRARVRGSLLLQKPIVRAAINYQLRRKGVTPGKVAKTIRNALDATSTIVVGRDKTIEAVDHGMRLKAAHMALKIMNAYPDGVEGGGNGPAAQSQAHIHVHAEMSDGELRFLLLHGRYPTEVEKQSLRVGAAVNVEPLDKELEVEVEETK